MHEVDVIVMPLRRGDGEDDTYLVLFEEPVGRLQSRAREMAESATAAMAVIPASRDETSEKEISWLKQELGATREYLQSVIEQQEAANEELQSANEELQSANEEVQSANEELQSMNEELETSKEEIQSVNEEFATLNDELHTRNLDLSQTNDDLTNLLASVDMAIVMLGPDRRIRRFTSAASAIVGLGNGDVGRRLVEVKLAIEVPGLEDLVGAAIEDASSQERDVQGRDGRWYLLRVHPYRILENQVAGAVLLLVDVDSLKRAERSLRESEQRFEVLAHDAPALIWMSDLEGCRFVNRAFERFVGEPESEVRTRGDAAYVHPDDCPAYLENYAQAVRAKRGFEMQLRLRRADGAYRRMKVIAAPRFVQGDAFMGLVGSMFDVTDLAEGEPRRAAPGGSRPQE